MNELEKNLMAYLGRREKETEARFLQLENLLKGLQNSVLESRSQETSLSELETKLTRLEEVLNGVSSDFEKCSEAVESLSEQVTGFVDNQSQDWKKAISAFRSLKESYDKLHGEISPYLSNK